MKHLETYPFVKITEHTYHIVVYKDYKSYDAIKPFDIDSIAHFDRRTKYIHIPLNYTHGSNEYGFSIDIPDYVIFHEIVHSVLETCCQHYPLWLNEGLALLLQNIDSPFICGETTILFNLYIDAIHELLFRQIYLPYYPEFSGVYDLFHQNLISGLYVYFLWSKMRLYEFVSLVNASRGRDLFVVITKGNLRIYEKEKKEFLDWLLEVKPNKRYAGC